MQRYIFAGVALAALACGPAPAQTPAQGGAKPPGQEALTQRHESVERAAETPLEDLNLKKVNIPEPLQKAVANPYDTAGLDRCPDIAADVARLDAALGPDRDAPPAPKGKLTAGGVMRAGVEGVIPYRGWIRQLTGAAKRQQQVQEAIVAGSTRRGYLKGVGMRMNCGPPAAPAWFKPAPPAAKAAPRPAVRRARPAAKPN